MTFMPGARTYLETYRNNQGTVVARLVTVPEGGERSALPLGRQHSGVPPSPKG